MNLRKDHYRKLVVPEPFGIPHRSRLWSQGSAGSGAVCTPPATAGPGRVRGARRWASTGAGRPKGQLRKLVTPVGVPGLQKPPSPVVFGRAAYEGEPRERGVPCLSPPSRRGLKSGARGPALRLGRQSSPGPGKQRALPPGRARPAPERRCRPDAVSLSFYFRPFTLLFMTRSLGRGPCARPGSSPVVAPAPASEPNVYSSKRWITRLVCR